MLRAIKKLIRQKFDINEMQLYFMSESGTTDTIFILLRKKYLPKIRIFTFYGYKDLDKAFDQVSKDVVWWVLGILDVEEWLFRCLRQCRGMLEITLE